MDDGRMGWDDSTPYPNPTFDFDDNPNSHALHRGKTSTSFIEIRCFPIASSESSATPTNAISNTQWTPIQQGVSQSENFQAG
ncbi:hypothetical protein VNO78_21579 [Psophocarpus tetragonolobus]|uniref:Uncharacterized protein n=1 Tax=Psophocarpus tetragonolobus TaxID=3891 RepID=A0AAN9SDJ7_PSOTE